MCGIVGFSYKLGQNAPKNALNTACGTLAHRGPDDNGFFEDKAKGIGLAHTRLSILDLSLHGHQPMLSSNSKVVLVFNGEIYNFRELRTDLEAIGYQFFGDSDTEVLLNLYMNYRSSGEDLVLMLRRLNGIFAFAIWDAEKNTLLVARDAMGVKPLYFSAENGNFFFASEIKALLPFTGSLYDLDSEAVHSYLTFLWCPGISTPSKRVRKLAPGEFMWISYGKIQEKKFWYEQPLFRQVAKINNRNSAVSGVEHHLRQAIHRQMVADVPVGAFLSGGLDSSSIVAFAREINPKINCFTIEMGGSRKTEITDDLPYARIVAKHLGVPLEIVRIDPIQMAEDLANMVSYLDEPLADPACLNVLYISQLARKFGIKVLLSGAGGDDLFTGYRRHYAVTLERYWRWLPSPIRKGLHHVTGHLDQRKEWARRLCKFLNGAALDGDAHLVNYFAWARREDLFSLYSPNFRAAVGEASAETTMLEFLSGLPQSVPTLERMLALEQRFFLADHNLIYTDKMSMAAGVEVRVPFLDLDLVDFAQQIPTRFKQWGSEGKWVLKKAMESYLPHEVIYRPKTGFGAPLRRWLRFELREWLGEVLSEASLNRRGLFDPAAVHRLIRANDEGRVDASYTLLSLVCIELWCRRFIDEGAKSKEIVYPSFN